MLGKMMMHGLVVAILVGGAAAVYAQAKDNGYLSAAPAKAGTDNGPAARSDNGYLSPTNDVRTDRDGRKHAARPERHAEGPKGQDKRHDHDD